MRKIIIATIAAILLGTAAQAAGRNFGLGLVLGDPTGFTGKYWTSGRTALDFNIGWSGAWHDRDVYWNSNCYDPGFYDRNRSYCNDQARDYRGEYGRGYRNWRIFHMHADYLFHNFNAIRATEKFPLFYGPGLALNYLNYDYLEIGARGNFGIAWMPRNAPMDVFLEIGPTIYIFPAPDFDVNAGLGARFYF